MARSQRTALLGLLVIANLATVACKDTTSYTPSAVRDSALSYADLQLTWETRHQGLRDELALVKADDGFPRALSSRRLTPESSSPAWQRPNGHTVSDSKNAAIAMMEAIPVSKRGRLRRQIERGYPSDLQNCSALELERIHDVLENFSKELTEFRRAAQLRESNFGFPYTEGLTADLSSIDVVMMGHRLMALSAIQDVYDDQLDGPVQALPDLFRVSSMLAAESNLTMRTAAAKLRIEALRILELVAGHPAVQREHVEAMLAAIVQQLEEWTDDAAAWRGERAIGLHAYEMVRDGQILSLLTPEEAKKVADEGPGRFGRAVIKTIDEDETFYLRTMREIIDCCNVPYYRRHQQLAQIEKEFAARQGGPSEPIVADMLLRKDLQWGQRLQATDRVLMEAWLLALSAALGEVAAEPPINPLSGEPYRIVQAGSRVEVHGVNPDDGAEPVWDEPLVAPVFER